MRQVLLNAKVFWYPIIWQLHRFMVAIFKVSVNHDGRGSTALTHLSGIRVVVVPLWHLCLVLSGVYLRSMVMLWLTGVVNLRPSLILFSRYSVRNFGVLLSFFRHVIPVTLTLKS